MGSLTPEKFVTLGIGGRRGAVQTEPDGDKDKEENGDE
jgi:hypothetical protein